MAYIKKVDTLGSVTDWLSEKIAMIAGHAIDTKKVGVFEEVTQKGKLQMYSILYDAVKYLNAEHAARSLSYECESRPDANIKVELVVSLKDKPSDATINPFAVVDTKVEVLLKWDLPVLL